MDDKDNKAFRAEIEHSAETSAHGSPKGERHADQLNTSSLVAKVLNPLAGIPEDRLVSDAARFAEEYGLSEHTDAFIKGALLAQKPHDYQQIERLTEDDKAAIDYEHSHKWSHPLALYLTIITCSLGAAVQGWDQTGSNGANLSFPQEFGIGGQSGADPWLVGIVNAGPYIGSFACGCWLSDPLNSFFGRRGTIFVTALILIATPIASGFTQSWQTLFVVRLIMGIGMGAKGSTVPIFAAENSPAPIRGALVMSWQLWTAFGIFLGFAANVVVVDTGTIAWRLQLGSAFIPAVPLAILVYLCPESGRWLMKKGRYQQAFKSFLRLRHHELQAARDMYYIHVQLEAEKLILRNDTYFGRIKELFTIPRVRRATLASGIVMLGQQLCGINIIAFYSSTIFAQSGFTDRQALYASLGFGALNFVGAFPAIFTIDTFGRRSLLLFTFPNMCWALVATALSFLVPDSQERLRLGLVATFIYIFTLFYSTGEGPVPFTYSAEAFPLAQREVGMSWSVIVCLFFAAVLSLTFPAMLDTLGQIGSFFLYAGFNAIAFVLIWLFLPETKARTLEELDEVFEVPTGVFIKYNAKEVAPWTFNKYILRKNNQTLNPLVYHDQRGSHAVIV